MFGCRRFLLLAVCASACFALGSPSAWPVDINGVLPAAFDQPMINFYISTTANGAPLQNPDPDPWLGASYFNVTAYFDTGASGILISNETFTGLSVPQSYSGTDPVIYEDVGVGGSQQFYLSGQVYLTLAGNPGADLDNLATYRTSYNQPLGPVRLQMSQTPVDIFSGEFPLDVVGIPAMQGKVIVMDPKPLDDVWNTFDGIHTYVYNPGTPFRAATADTDPGIPTTNRHLRLSYASFDSFTRVTPDGALGPTLAENPFIGPNPVAKLYGGPADNTPGVTVSYNGLKTTGSFLFDTGAAASMISTSLAAALHIRYVGGSQTSGVLELFDPTRPGWSAPLPDQFTIELGGIGGTTTAAGFYLDSMLLRTLEGDPNNDFDPNHLVFRGVPVLVDDITVQDPITLQTLTLDGIFGMNNLVASTTPDWSGFATGNFNWIVFDQPNGILGLDVKASAASWTGGGNPLDANWMSDANWGGKAPADGYALSFGSAAPVSVNNYNNFADGTKFAGIAFAGTAAFNLQGHRIALTGDVVNISTQTQTVSLNLTLTGASRAFVADSADIVVAGIIDGDEGLIKTGVKKLILKSANTYTGDTTVSQGTLTLDDGSLDVASTVNISDGAMLEAISGTPTLGDIIGHGTVAVTGAGTVLTARSIAVDTLSIGVAITSAYWTGASESLDPHWTVAANWDGVAPSAGDVLKFGQAMAISIDNSNDFAPNFRFGGIGFWGDSAFTLSGNKIRLAGNVSNNSSQPQTIDLDLELVDTARGFDAATADIVVSGHISGSQGLIKTGTASLVLTSTNSYTGATNIRQGAVVFDGGDLADSSAISIAAGAELDVISGTPTLGNITGQGTVTVSGNGTVLSTPSITADRLTIGTTVAGTAVPEPTAIVLLGLGLVVGLVCRRRMR